MSMNLTGLGLDEVTRLYRLAERDVEKLQRDLRAAEASAARLEAMLEEVAPECPDCQLIRRDFGGDPRAPIGQHQPSCRAKDDEPAVDANEGGCPCGHDDFCHFDGHCCECECDRQPADSFLRDCEGAESVEDVRDLIGRYCDMPGNVTGGSLHIVLDDGNTNRSDVEHCARWANQRGDLAGVALTNLLLRLDEETYTKALMDDRGQPVESRE